MTYLDHLEKLLAEATPEPWEWRFENAVTKPSAYCHPSLLGPGHKKVLTANDGLGVDSEYQMWSNDSDKDLIASAPSALRLLVALARATQDLIAPDIPGGTRVRKIGDREDRVYEALGPLLREEEEKL